MINIRQAKAARAWLGLSQEELADAAGVDRRTVIRLENSDGTGSPTVLAKLQAVFEGMGAEFIFDGREGIGVRFSRRGRKET